MSSKLQLDVCHLSYGWRHLVNAYTGKTGVVYRQVNCVIHVWALWDYLWVENGAVLPFLSLPLHYHVVLFDLKLRFSRILDSVYGAFWRCSRFRLTPPKVNRFGWNLEHSCHEYIVGADFGRDPSIAIAGEPGKFFAR